MDAVGSVTNITPPQDEINLQDCIHGWCERLHKATKLVAKKSSSSEPYKFIYQALEESKILREEIQDYFKEHDTPEYSFWIKFALIHTYSCIAKWSEACDQLSDADNEHRLCILLIEQVLETEETFLPEGTKLEDFTELQYGFMRIRYLLIYELTRYAILCSERDNQEKALELLTRAEEFYHTKGGRDTIQISDTAWPTLSALDNLNSEKSIDMFVYVLFYLGQAFMITDNKEKAILYLHMVLRKQIEKKSSSITTWSSDAVRMATAVLTNVQSFQATKSHLLAATTVLNKASEQEKSTDEFKQVWADVGRVWIKLGLEILEASTDRLKDLEEQTRKPPKFSDTLQFTHFEKLSLDLSMEVEEFDTRSLVNSLTFPTLDFGEFLKNEMPIRYARDFEEARAIFLPLQRWFRISKEYYVIDLYASDYIELVADYATSFKYLVFFEPNMERQITMQKRRIQILEELLKLLNPVAYRDVFHYILKDLAEIYESIYKLKVLRARDRGEALRPKDKKLVKLLSQAVNAHRRNLENFQFNLNSTKDFPEEHEKALLGTVISIGRILGSICHDHPLHPDAIQFAQEGKAYYEYFLTYLNRRPPLKADFKVLFDGAVDLPQLLDAQVDRIKQRLLGLNIGG